MTTSGVDIIARYRLIHDAYHQQLLLLDSDDPDLDALAASADSIDAGMRIMPPIPSLVQLSATQRNELLAVTAEAQRLLTCVQSRLDAHRQRLNSELAHAELANNKVHGYLSGVSILPQYLDQKR